MDSDFFDVILKYAQGGGHVGLIVLAYIAWNTQKKATESLDVLKEIRDQFTAANQLHSSEFSYLKSRQDENFDLSNDIGKDIIRMQAQLDLIANGRSSHG